MPLVELDDIISSGDYDLAKSRLDSDQTVDLLREDAILVKVAIKSGNVPLVDLLLTYFVENQLSECDEGSDESNALKDKMNDAIESVTAYVTSEEMSSLLSTYVASNPSEHDGGHGMHTDHEHQNTHNDREEDVAISSNVHSPLSEDTLRVIQTSSRVDTVLSWISLPPHEMPATDSLLSGHHSIDAVDV